MTYAAQPVPLVMMESSIDFGDLLAHDVPLEWHEAVAVVQEAIEKLVGSGAGAPDPAHIRLHRSGTIELLPEPPSAEPATQRLGYTLNALLQVLTPPAELRLFTSEAISVAAAVPVEDFSRRLAYFERPGRSRVLQLLYERAALALAAALVRRQADGGPVAVSVPSTAPKEDAKAGAQRHAGRWIAAFAALMVCGLTVLGWQWLRTHNRTAPASTALMPAVSRTRAVVGSLIAGTVSSGRALLARTGLVDAPEAAAVPEPDTHRDVKVRSTRDRRTPAARASGTSGESSLPAVAPETGRKPAGPASPSPPAALAATTDDVSADGTVYTPNAPDVVPPTLIWPQLPTTPDATDPPSPSIGEVDLLVNEDGAVEAVKLLTVPGGFHQRMLLSAMKAWRYHPAMKDGRPVRYIVRVKIPF